MISNHLNNYSYNYYFLIYFYIFLSLLIYLFFVEVSYLIDSIKLSIIRYFNNLYRLIIYSSKKITKKKKKKNIKRLYSNSSKGGGPRGPRPPRKSWKERIKDHVKKYKKYYSIFGIVVIGSIVQIPIDIEMNYLKEIFENISQSKELINVDNNNTLSNYKPIYKIKSQSIQSIVHSHFNRLEYFDQLFNKLDLNLGLSSMLIALYEIQNSLIPLEMQNNFTHCCSEFYWDYLKMVKFIDNPMNFSSYIDTHFRVSVEFLNWINEVQMYSNRISFSDYKLLRRFFKFYLKELHLTTLDSVFYFQYRYFNLTENQILHRTLEIYKKDLYLELSSIFSTSSHGVDNQFFASIVTRRALLILYGSFTDNDPRPVAQNLNEFLQLKKSLFVQALRVYYMTQKTIDESFNIYENKEHYDKFYDFYINLIEQYHRLPGPNIDHLVNFNSIQMVILLDSFECKDFVHVDRNTILPTTLSDSEESSNIRFINDNFVRYNVFTLDDIINH